MTNGASVNLGFCNIFGAETGGANRVLGGLTEQKADRQWYCKNRAMGRYRMECDCGHRGQIMHLCENHIKEYSGKVRFCPRCNTSNTIAHNCQITIRGVS